MVSVAGSTHCGLRNVKNGTAVMHAHRTPKPTMIAMPAHTTPVETRGTVDGGDGGWMVPAGGGGDGHRLHESGQLLDM